MKHLLKFFVVTNLSLALLGTNVVLASPYGCGAYGSETYQSGACGTTTTGGGTSGGNSGGTTTSSSGGTSTATGGNSATTKKKAASATGGGGTATTTEDPGTAATTEETTTPAEQTPTISLGPVKLPANEKIAVANKKLPVTGVQVLGIIGITLVATAVGMLFWYYRHKHKDNQPGPGSGGAPPTILIPPSSID
jgi:cobalamin biosynthesis Mg chelatase CobN